MSILQLSRRKASAACILAAVFSGAFCACGQGTLSVGPIADAFVATGPTDNLANDNFGAAGALALAAGDLPNGQFQTVMQFDLSSAASTFNAEFGAGDWTVQSATLQLTSSPHNNSIFNAPAAGQFNISLMQNNSWVEGTGTGGTPTTDGISFNSLTGTYINASADQALGAFHFPGGSTGVNTYTLNLTPGLTGDILGGDDLSLRLYAGDNNISYLFSSHEASPNGPELIITAVPEPGGLALGLTGLAVFSLRRFIRLPRDLAEARRGKNAGRS